MTSRSSHLVAGLVLAGACLLPTVLILRAIPPGWEGEWDFTHYLVTNSVSRKLEFGMMTPLSKPKGDRTWHTEPRPPEEEQYFNQLGLQAFALAAVVRTAGWEDQLESSLLWLRYPYGVCSGVLYGLLLFWVWKRLGCWPFVFAMAFYPWAIKYQFLSHTFYWTEWLILAPVALLWWGYDPEASPAARYRLSAGFAVLMALKCMCCYEYLSQPLLGALTAIVFRNLDEGRGIRKLLYDLVWYGAAGAAGVVAAMVIHFGYLAYLKGLATAWAGTGGNAVDRSFAGEFEGMTTRQRLSWHAWSIYAALAQDKPIPILGMAGIAVSAWVLVRTRRTGLSARARAAMAAAAYAFLAGLFWSVFMGRHALRHPEFGGLSYYPAFSVFGPAAIALLLFPQACGGAAATTSPAGEAASRV